MVYEHSTLETTLQRPCAPVGDEFGDPVSAESLAEFQRNYPDVIDEVAERQIAAQVWRPEDVETGAAAGRTLKALGCVGCELSGTCAVRTHLEGKEAKGEQESALTAQATMISSAPRWLKAARIRTHGDPERLGRLTRDLESTKQALKSGELNLSSLLGDVTNEPADMYTAQQLSEFPELRDVKARLDGEYLAHNITTEAGKFTVIDASQEPIEGATEELGILYSKFANRMAERGSDGLPQIMHPDLKMQKKLKGFSNVYELRMAGKNRLYFTIEELSDDPEQVARIVILGSHGGSEATQRQFLESLRK